MQKNEQHRKDRKGHNPMEKPAQAPNAAPCAPCKESPEHKKWHKSGQ